MGSQSLADKKIVIIGGCGHVGLPLGIKFALAGAETVLLDIDAATVERINAGQFPFLEKHGEEQLSQALTMRLRASTDPAECRASQVVVFVTGTPVDEHLNPKLSDVIQVFDSYRPYFVDGGLVVMRSTLFPGTMNHLYQRLLQGSQNRIRLAFCPERIAQGVALEEIDSLPQIVASFDEESFQAALELFREISPEVIRLTPTEAEVTKLMANSWRYLEFAIANQFYLIAEENGLDFNRIFQAIRYRYPRAQGYKRPGFAAGPCLFKDTMQLSSYFDHQFSMGHSAMLVNEGLATFVVRRVMAQLGGNLWGKTVGLLGMTFKANNDDVRESLSFKVKKGLEFAGAGVLWNDPYLSGSTDLNLLEKCADLFVLCTPHQEYREWKSSKPMVDVWAFFPTEPLETHLGTGYHS